jgi:hypothetical protein
MTGLAVALGSGPPRPAPCGRPGRLTGLRVFVVGLDTHVSRDAIRFLIAHDADATVLGEDHELDLLQRDLGLFGVVAKLAPIETMAPSEIRLVTENLRDRGGLPHLVVCCCTGATCPASQMAALMAPPLVLHAVSPDPVRLDAVFAPSLAVLLARRDLLNPAVSLPRVRLGRRLFDVRRRERQAGRRTVPTSDHLVCVADNTVKAARR